MATIPRINLFAIKNSFINQTRLVSTPSKYQTYVSPNPQEKIDPHFEIKTGRKVTEETNKDGLPIRKSFKESVLPHDWRDMRFKYPEFLPPTADKNKFRNPLKEKLQRQDMLKRRTVINIPEFYVGSILSVEYADQNAAGKESRFVGICIQREGQLLEANFTLRNIIDGHGIEIRFDIYNPCLRHIEVLKLEKRIDSDLRYLRDALPQYSTVPVDMVAIPHDDSQPVPINEMLVELKPRPWSHKWERHDFQGIAALEDIPQYMYDKFRNVRSGYHTKLKYDTMIDYREHVTEDEQYEIWKDVVDHEKVVGEARKLEKRRRMIQEQLKKKFIAS